MSNPRMSVTFTKPQMAAIEQKAAELGVSEAEVVRQLVAAGAGIGVARGSPTQGTDAPDIEQRARNVK